MEMNTFVTTAFEPNCRVQSAERYGAAAFTGHAAFGAFGFVQHSIEIEGEAPLIAVAEAFDA